MKKTLIWSLFFFTTYSLLLTTPSFVYAQVPTPEAWSDRCQEGGVAKIQGFECIFTNIVRVLTPIAGLLVFIMIIVGAFQLITAGGEAKEVQKARKTLTAAIAGLVLLIGIWFILLLIKTITGVDVTKFEIPGP